MDTLPGSNPMEEPPHSPLGGLDPANLLKQGVAEDTFMDGASTSFNPPPIEELAAIFPQFEILELIGKGGMGAVYKVRQKDLDRLGRVKVADFGIAKVVAAVCDRPAEEEGNQRRSQTAASANANT